MTRLQFVHNLNVPSPPNLSSFSPKVVHYSLNVNNFNRNIKQVQLNDMHEIQSWNFLYLMDIRIYKYKEVPKLEKVLGVPFSF
jgi:hypothetical protein